MDFAATLIPTMPTQGFSQQERSTTVLDNENNLIARAQQGDHLAFTAILKFYDRRIMKLILRFTGNQYDRDDLYQNIFTACFIALPKFSQQSSFYIWLYRLAMNQCIDFMRKHKPMETLEKEASIDPNWEQQQQLAVVSKALAKLDGPQRISFHLFYVEQWPSEEIAKLLECSLGSVKSHLDRARKKIRQDNEVAPWLIDD